MAAYRRVDDCGLTACTPGSAPGPTLGNEYGKPLAFFILSFRLTGQLTHVAVYQSSVDLFSPPGDDVPMLLTFLKLSIIS